MTGRDTSVTKEKWCAPKVALVRTICTFAAHQNLGRCAERLHGDGDFPLSYLSTLALISFIFSGKQPEYSFHRSGSVLFIIFRYETDAVWKLLYDRSNGLSSKRSTVTDILLPFTANRQHRQWGDWLAFIGLDQRGMVVGYQQNSVPNGYAMITPCFETVGGGNYPIDNLIIEGASDDDSVTVQVVNPDGTWGINGVWLNAFEDYPAGWFTDSSGEESADIRLKPGQAVFFYSSSSSVKVQSAGQVAGVITNSVSAGYSMIGNATPVVLPIDSITIEGASDDDSVTVQIVNPDGTWGTNGVWLNAFEEYPAGWFTDSSGEESADITLQPGQSVFFYTSATSAKVIIPSAL